MRIVSLYAQRMFRELLSWWDEGDCKERFLGPPVSFLDEAQLVQLVLELSAGAGFVLWKGESAGPRREKHYYLRA